MRVHGRLKSQVQIQCLSIDKWYLILHRTCALDEVMTATVSGVREAGFGINIRHRHIFERIFEHQSIIFATIFETASNGMKLNTSIYMERLPIGS